MHFMSHAQIYYKMAVRSQPPTLMLYDFIISKRKVPEANVEELQYKLSSYDEEHRRTIINTHMIRLNERTLVHVTAAMNLAPFLEVLLENGGEHMYLEIKISDMHLFQYIEKLYIENFYNSSIMDAQSSEAFNIKFSWSG